MRVFRHRATVHLADCAFWRRSVHRLIQARVHDDVDDYDDDGDDVDDDVDNDDDDEHSEDDDNDDDGDDNNDDDLYDDDDKEGNRFQPFSCLYSDTPCEIAG